MSYSDKTMTFNTFFKTYLKIILPSLLVIVISTIAYFSRWIFFYHFDPVYWENAYYESQWNVPNSARGIGDEGVYRYIGYRLVNNRENPFNVDYWVPPLGKYTYGLTAKFLGNPFITTFIYYLGSILIFYLISKQIFPTPYHWITTILFASNPMIVDEIQTTMLDLPLTFFFLLFIYFFIRYLSSKNNNILYLSALSLGLMAGVKPPFFIPMFALVAAYFLFKKRLFKKVIPFFIFIFIGYVLAYFCYFIKHPNPIPWIRLHQKVIAFQKNNGGSHDWFNIIRYIFTIEFRGFWVGAKSYWPTNWSVILPVGVISTVLSLYKFVKKKPLPEWLSYCLLITIFYLMMNLIIDFWPRYLVPLVPILILISCYFLKKYKLIPLLIFVTYLPFLYLFLFPKSTDLVSSFQNLYTSGFYKDSYELLDSKTKKQFGLSQWQYLSKNSLFSDNKFNPIKENNQWRMSIEIEKPK